VCSCLEESRLAAAAGGGNHADATVVFDGVVEVRDLRAVDVDVDELLDLAVLEDAVAEFRAVLLGVCLQQLCERVARDRDCLGAAFAEYCGNLDVSHTRGSSRTPKRYGAAATTAPATDASWHQ
jgi:hypothetical protein